MDYKTSLRLALALLPGALLLAANTVSAEERHAGHEPRAGHEAPRGAERHDGRDGRESYRARHWVYDNRFRHGHYYPSPGYAVGVLPSGHIGVGFGRGRYFFHSGVWYRPGASGYVVVQPPLGIVIPVLPLGYTTVWAGGIPYYYANNVYYTGNPGNYVVAAPPDSASMLPPEAAAPAAPEPLPGAAVAPPAQTPGTWYYCESAKAYYPYVATCPEEWRPVAATPPGER